MEPGDHGCLARLPSRKTVLAVLALMGGLLTLVLVHLSGQWVGERVSTKMTNRRGFGRPLGHQMPHKGAGKKAGISEWDSQAKRKKNKEWLPDERVPLRKSLSNDGADLWKDFDNSETSSVQDIAFLGRQDQAPSNEGPTGFQNVGVRDQTKHTTLPNKTGGRFFDAMLGHQTVRVSEDGTAGARQSSNTAGYQTSNALAYPTRKVLQGAIRKAMKQTESKEQHGKNWSRRNIYEWNDRDGESYRTLPLRSKDDREWKRGEALIFNRVGKCGSRSVIDLLRKLSDTNNFNFVSSIVYNTTHISSSWQNYIARTLDRLKTPYLFQRHLHFIDFTEFNARQPMYINIIRDPLARFVSNYYFKRFGDGRSNQNFKGTEQEKYRSVTDCILQSHSECVQKGIWYILPFFCGQQKACRQPSQWALERAKQNVEKHFVVVGILEDLENSFRVFEKVLPGYFTGMVKLFNEPDEKQLLKNSSTLTKKKEKPSAEAAAIMKRLMHYEYDFYDFVKGRLERQMAQYGIQSER